MPSFAVVKAEDCSMGYSAKHWLGNLVARGILLQRPLCHRARLWRCSWVPPLGGQPWFDARYAEMRPDASEGCTVEGWLACESGLKRGSRVAQGKARQAVVPLAATRLFFFSVHRSLTTAISLSVRHNTRLPDNRPSAANRHSSLISLQVLHSGPSGSQPQPNVITTARADNEQQSS
jgi:hypothetical protein